MSLRKTIVCNQTLKLDDDGNKRNAYVVLQLKKREHKIKHV